MPENPLVYQTSIWIPEVTPGVALTPTKRLLCSQVMPNPEITNSLYRPAGSIAPVVQIMGKERASAALDGVVCFNDLIYPLNSLLMAGTITTPAGTVRLHTFKPSNSVADTYKTFTIQHGFSTFGQQLAYVIVNSLNMAFSDAEATMSGTLFGQAISDGVTVNPSPTDIAVSPVIPKQVDVYLGTALATNEVQSLVATGASSGTFKLIFQGQTTGTIAFGASAATVQTALEALTTIGVGNIVAAGGPLPTTPVTLTGAGVLAGLNFSLITADNTLLVGGSAVITETTPGGMTKLLRVDRAEIAIPDRYVANNTLDANQPSFSYVVQQGVQPTATIVLEHDSQSAGYMANFRAGQTLYLTIFCRGPLIEAGYAQYIKIQAPVKITQSARADANAVYANTYSLGLVYDTTFAGWISIAVQNALTAL